MKPETEKKVPKKPVEPKVVLKRDHKLDKDLPFKYGYAWAPAVIDDVPFMALSVQKTDVLGITVKKKVVKGSLYYQKTLLGRKVTYNGQRGSLTAVGVDPKKVIHIGRRFVESTNFALYNAMDVGQNSKRGKEIRDDVRARTYVLQDSGGFQLVSGREEFIDPLMLAEKHSLYADSGVSLDLPVSGVTDREFALVAARMLIANTKVLLENTDPKARIMNVAHGATLSIRSAFIDMVIREPAHSLCIAGLRKSATQVEKGFDRTTPLAFASHILLSMLKTEKIYPHYHVLGVATPWQMAIISLIANLHQKVVTSDSASHNLSGLGGLLVDYGNETSHSLAGRLVTRKNKLYCSCPMCYTFQDYPWYKIGPSWAASLHNGFSFLRYARLFDHLGKMVIDKKMTSGEISKVMLENIEALPPAVIQSFRKAVHLILATKNWKQLKDMPEDPKSLGLFGVQKRGAEKVSPRFVEVIKKYEKYHNQKWL